MRNKTIKPNRTNNKNATFATRLFDFIKSLPPIVSDDPDPDDPIIPEVNLLKGFVLDPCPDPDPVFPKFILYIYYKRKTPLNTKTTLFCTAFH